MFERIVVGLDGSASAAKAVEAAIGLASTHEAVLDLVSAYTPEDPAAVEAARREAPEEVAWAVTAHSGVDQILADAAANAHAAGVEVHKHPRTGDASSAILDVAEEVGADLIVVGNKGMSGVRRFVLGSVPNKVSHHATCSVLIIHTTG